MDVVYLVRGGELNEELRWSLRSIDAHLPHRSVVLAGFRPPWTADVGHIPVQQTGTKYQNSSANLLAACLDPFVSDPFWVLHDDMFAMAPTGPTGPPTLHRGPVVEVIAEYEQRHGTSRYLTGMRATARRLAELGHPDPLSYELHVPLIVHKPAMLHALEAGADITTVHKRTLYGNLAGLGGHRHDDVKVCADRPSWSPAWPWLSTDDHTFAAHPVGAHIRARFPERCRYETR